MKYAYERKKLEELPEPYSLEMMKSRGWLKGRPQRYCFLKPPMAEAVLTLQLGLVFDPHSGSAAASQVRDEDGEGNGAALPARKGKTIHELAQPARVVKSRRQSVAGKKHASLEHWLEKRDTEPS